MARKGHRNTFTKIAGSTYPCGVCGRRTRNTGAQSVGSELCPQCWELAGIENTVSDYGVEEAGQYREEAVRLVAEIIEKGGNPDTSSLPAEWFAEIGTQHPAPAEVPAAPVVEAPAAVEAPARTLSPAAEATIAKLAGFATIAKEIEFPAEHVAYINWTAIGEERAKLACDVEVLTLADGAVRFTFGWRR